MAVTKVYGQSVLPSDTVTVLAGDTIDVSLGFNSTIGIVGNMDTVNGSATTGSVEEVASLTQARNLFGSASELTEAVELAYANGVSDVYAVAVPETSYSETFGTTTSTVSSGTVANTPVVDPNVAWEHSVDVTDDDGTSLTVNIVYEPTVSTPTTTDTVNFNPLTGDWAADAADVYTVDYDTAAYDQAIADMTSQNVRFVNVLSEDEGVANTLLTELQAEADEFDFKRGVVGAKPRLDPARLDSGAADPYNLSYSDQRIVTVAPSRATTGDGEVHTSSAVAGLLTSRPLGAAAFGVNQGAMAGLTGIVTEFKDGDLATLADDKGILPVKRGRNIHIAKDMTTSTDDRFSRVYVVEVVDEAALISHLVCENYIAEPNTAEQLQEIEDNHRTAYDDMKADNPPQLDAYKVDAREGASASEVVVEIALDVVDVIDVIDVTVTVGEIRSEVELAEAV